MADIIMSVLVVMGVLTVMGANILLARENWHRR
jgi:hypothetical protein